LKIGLFALKNNSTIALLTTAYHNRPPPTLPARPSPTSATNSACGVSSPLRPDDVLFHLRPAQSKISSSSSSSSSSTTSATPATSPSPPLQTPLPPCRRWAAGAAAAAAAGRRRSARVCVFLPSRDKGDDAVDGGDAGVHRVSKRGARASSVRGFFILYPCF